MKYRMSQMSNGTIANMYSENRIYSPSATNNRGLIVAAHHNGQNIAIQAKPIAPIADYENWFRSRNKRYGGKVTPAKIRRIVIMRRQGATWKECGEAVGMHSTKAREWVEFLPFDLAV